MVASTVHTYPRLWALAVLVQQHLFFLYHFNSYANQPLMLITEKPMIMRDLFLTQCSAPYPNPLSCLYTTRWYDIFINCNLAWMVGVPLGRTIGCHHNTFVWFLGGLFASFSYQFQSQLNKVKNADPLHDFNCASNGSFAALSSVSWLLNLKVPLLNIPAHYVTIPVVAGRLLEEYYLAPAELRRYRQDREEQDEPVLPQVHNWGSLGGCFLGLIYGTLLIGRRRDITNVSTFFANFARR